MSSVNLGGSNIVFQVDRDTLLQLIQLQVPLQGQAMIPPFRLATRAPQNGTVVGAPVPSLVVIVRGMTLALTPGSDRGHLLLDLGSGVLRLTGQPPLVIQAGTLDIELQFLRGSLLLVRKLRSSFRDLHLAGVGDPSPFMAQANAEADRLLDTTGDRAVDVDVFPNPVGAPPNALKGAALLGGVSQVTDAQTLSTLIGGTPGGPVSRLIQPGYSVALGQAAAFVLDTLIRPSLVAQLLDPNDPTADLPPPWGNGKAHRESGGGVKKVSVDITRLDIVFADGHLEVTGRFDARGRCWSVSNGRFGQWTYLDLIASTPSTPPVLVPRLDPPSPHLTCKVDVDFLCELGVVAVTGLLGGMIYGLVAVMVVEGGLLNDNKPSVRSVATPVPLIATIYTTRWRAVQIVREGAIVQGDLRVSLPAPAALAPAVYIKTTETVTPAGAPAAGEVEVSICGSPRMFDFVEQGQVDGMSLEAQPRLLVEPIRYQWSVNGTPLTERAGVLSYAGTIKLALPPPFGTRVEDHKVELGYLVGIPSLLGGDGYGDLLALTPRAIDGNYDFYVEVQATDAAGQTVGNAVDLKIVGDQLDLGPDYYAYVSECMQEARDLVDKKGARSVMPKPGEPNEHLQELVAHILDHIEAGNVVVHELVEAAVLAFGAEQVAAELATQTLPIAVRSIQ